VHAIESHRISEDSWIYPVVRSVLQAGGFAKPNLQSGPGLNGRDTPA